MNNECAVSIDAGVQDYQIFQQNAEGQVCISVRGHFKPDPERKNSQVILRLVCENSGHWVTRNTGWQLASQQVLFDYAGHRPMLAFIADIAS